MNCPNCSSPIADGAAFCAQCGTKISAPHRASSTGGRRSEKTSVYSSRADLHKTRAMKETGRRSQAQSDLRQVGGGHQTGRRQSHPIYPTDLSIIFDCTGSMQPYIDGLKNMVIGFSRDLESNNIDVRLGLVEYRDVKIGEATIVHGFANSPDQFRNWIGSLQAMGGGDEPESAIDAGYSGINELSFRENATKVFTWITDASYHEPAGNGQTMDALIQELVTRRIITYVIGPDLPGYRRLADAMGGILFDIRNNPEEFRRIVKSLGQSISETVPRMRDIRAAADAALSRTKAW